MFASVQVYNLDSVQVSLENSNFKQAVEDLMTCLAKRLKALPADSRFLIFSK